MSNNEGDLQTPKEEKYDPVTFISPAKEHTNRPTVCTVSKYRNSVKVLLFD